MLETPPAMLIDIESLKFMLDDYGAEDLKEMFCVLYDRAVNGVIPGDLRKDMKPLYKLFWNTIEGGFISKWESQIFGAIKKKDSDDDFWIEWARHPEYTDLLFRDKKHIRGYNLAQEEHKRLLESRGLKTPQGGSTIKENRTESNRNITEQNTSTIEGNRDDGKGEEDTTISSVDDIKARLTEIIIQESGDREKGLQYAEQYFDTKNSIWGKTWEYFLETHLEPQMGLVNHARYYAKQRKQIDEQA